MHDFLPMREELAVKNLSDVKEIFDKLGIKYWLGWGTLLGAVREGKIIGWDHDIDLETTNDNIKKIVLAFPELEKRGFYIQFSNLKFREGIYFDRFNCLISITPYKIKNKYALSTIFAWPTNFISNGLSTLHYLLLFPKAYVVVPSKFKSILKILTHCLSLLPPKSRGPLSSIIWSVARRTWNRFGQIIIPKRYFEKLGTMKFYGMTFNIPSEVGDYLEYLYGKDWRIPKKKWELKMSGAIRALRVLPHN